MSDRHIEDVLSSVAERWGRIDPLLPEPVPPADSGCGAEFTVPAASGRSAAVGWCRHRVLEPGAPELTWGAAGQFWLTARTAGEQADQGTGAALDELLVRWREHLATQPGSGDQDTQAGVRWPSRDFGGVRALLRHGLQPLAVIAARPIGRPTPEPAPWLEDLRIRPAGPGDVDAVTALVLEVVRFDQHFGAVQLRPHTEQAERLAAEQTLSKPEPWTWLAERDGQVVGLLTAEPPDRATWIAPLTRPGSVAYLATMSVLPDQRGAGVGNALVAGLNRKLDETGVEVTLLHHSQLNPLSAPFWARMGYRPLWTSWEIRPASDLR
jgi:predicted N-acetyltransferase YhbS